MPVGNPNYLSLVNILESSVVVQELELAINLALYGFYGV